MKKSYKLILTLLLVLVVFTGLSAVSAADINVSNDSSSISTVNSNTQTSDLLTGADYSNYQTSVDNSSDYSNEYSSNLNDVAVTSDGNTTTSTGSYVDLANLINNSNGTVSLERNYTYNALLDTNYTNGVNITKNLVINGNGYTISANNQPEGIFNIYDSTVTLNDLNLINDKSNTGNYDGGAIAGVNSTIFVNNCNFANNHENNYGGAIYVYLSNLTVTNSSFINNTAYKSGGAIFLIKSNASILNSSFMSNNASSNGGALLILNSSTTINNCSFINNRAIHSPSLGGAIYVEGNSDTTINDTVFVKDSAMQGGAIFSENNKLTVTYSVLVDNSATYGSDIYSPNGATLNYDWWGTNTPTSTTNPVTKNTQIYGTILSNYVIMTASKNGNTVTTTLNTYTDNGNVKSLTNTLPSREITYLVSGGYATPSSSQTGPTGASSTNITGGDLYTVVYIDNQRIIFGTLLQDVYVSTTGSSTGIGTEDNPLESIAHALRVVKENGTIHVKTGTYTNQANITIPFNVNITGYGGNVVLSAASDSRIFEVPYSNVDVTFNNLIIRDANLSDANGAGIIFASTSPGILKIVNCTFINDSAILGGAVYMYGPINTTAGEIIIINSTFTNNTATQGGAVYSRSGNLTSINTTYTNNTATKLGGAIKTFTGVYILNSTFTQNNASAGGAICTNGTASLIDSNFKNNNADYGGAVFTDNNTFVTGSNFKFNNAKKSGGAIYSNNNIIVNDSFFLNNTANAGGAIITPYNSITVNNSGFMNNTADYGGALIAPRVNVTETYFINNIANIYGGAIGASNATVNYCVLLNNTGNTGSIGYDGNYCNANYNWWGNNTPFNGTDYNDLIYHEINSTSHEYVKADNWVLMTLSVNSTNVTLGDIIKVTVDFKHYTDGNNTYNMTSLIPEMPVKFICDDGYSINKTRITDNNSVYMNYHTKTAGNFTTTVSSPYQTLTFNFTVNPLTNKDTVLWIMNTYYVYGNNTFYGLLTDININPVIYRTVSLNLTRVSTGAWKVYNVTTNIDGLFALPITLAPGLYNVSGVFNGDTDYNPSNVSSATLTIVANENNTILTANTFQEKYKAGQNFTGSLCLGNGHRLANQTIAVKLTRLSNGLSKVYYVTTDSNGDYQLPINLGVGSYKAECSYAGTSVYTSSSASASLTVTK